MRCPSVFGPTAIVLVTELETGPPVRNPELWQRLQSTPITLSDGVDLGVVLTDRYQIRPQGTAALMMEYRRFLYLVATTDEVLAPSTVVDQLWHLHLADAAGWRDYCHSFFGRELHQVSGRPAPERDPAYLRTLTLIRKEFDISPDASFWPDPRSRAQKGKFSLDILFSGLAVTLFVFWMAGPGWGAVALILSLIIAVERFIAAPSNRLQPRSEDGGNSVISNDAEPRRRRRYGNDSRPGFTDYRPRGGDGGDSGGE